jgi:hypothetical protein
VEILNWVFFELFGKRSTVRSEADGQTLFRRSHAGSRRQDVGRDTQFSSHRVHFIVDLFVGKLDVFANHMSFIGG